MKKIPGIILIVILIGAALLIRILMFPFSNSDLNQYIIPWFDTIATHGGLAAIKDPFYNYSPPYLYLLALATLLKEFLPAIAAIKLISVGFDFVAAWVLFRIIRLRYPDGVIPWLGFFGVLFAPTVFIDSAFWGQCDGIYSTFLLLCVYFCCTRKYHLALLCFTSAFAFKAQAVFLAPLILLLYLKGLLRWRTVAFIPATFLGWMLPSLAVGYPLADALGTYLRQVETYHQLSMGAPNIYVFISNAFYDLAVPTGSALTVLIGGFFVWMAAKRLSDLDPGKVICFSLFSALLLPFILPKMHERYFYFAALLALALPFFKPKLRLAALALQVSSVLSYAIYFMGAVIIPIEPLAVLNGGLVCVLAVDFFREFGQPVGSLKSALF
jgi:Gpi18-like mannosyltransferase